MSHRWSCAASCRPVTESAHLSMFTTVPRSSADRDAVGSAPVPGTHREASVAARGQLAGAMRLAHLTMLRSSARAPDERNGLMNVAERLDGLADQTLGEVLSGDIAADRDGLAA